MTDLISGNLVNQFNKEVKKVPFIGAGVVFEHEGPVEVQGDIGMLARVYIKNGGITVKGNVCDYANITTFVSEGFNNSSSDIKIKGTVGDDVTLISDASVDIKDAGYALMASSGKTFKAHNVEGYSHVASGDSIIAYSFGKKVELTAENNIVVRDKVGENSTIISHNNIRIKEIGRGSLIHADGNLIVEDCATGCTIGSGKDFKIGRTTGFRI